MADPFSTTIEKMGELGLFKFLFPFMLTAAIFYGLLRKSQLFGDPDRNISVNGIVCLVASFMVWAYPILSGVDVTLQLSSFFMQGLTMTLVVMFSLLIAGMFFPQNLSETLSKHFKGGGFWMAIIGLGILVGFIITVSSGLLNVFFPASTFGGMNQDTMWTIGIIVTLIITIVAVVGISRGGPPTPAPTTTKREGE
jgi:magnesium-transporting ATPase (P-type)